MQTRNRLKTSSQLKVAISILVPCLVNWDRLHSVQWGQRPLIATSKNPYSELRHSHPVSEWGEERERERLPLCLCVPSPTKVRSLRPLPVIGPGSSDSKITLWGGWVVHAASAHNTSLLVCKKKKEKSSVPSHEDGACFKIWCVRTPDGAGIYISRQSEAEISKYSAVFCHSSYVQCQRWKHNSHISWQASIALNGSFGF